MGPPMAGALLAPLFVAMDLFARRDCKPSTWSKQDLKILVPIAARGLRRARPIPRGPFWPRLRNTAPLLKSHGRRLQAKQKCRMNLDAGSLFQWGTPGARHKLFATIGAVT